MSDNPNKRNANKDEKKSHRVSGGPSGSASSSMPQDRFANANPFSTPYASSSEYSSNSKIPPTNSLNYIPILKPNGESKTPTSPPLQRTYSGTLIFSGAMRPALVHQGSHSGTLNIPEKKGKNSSSGPISGDFKKNQSCSHPLIQVPPGNIPFILTLSRGPYLKGISQLAEMVKNDRTINIVEVVIKHPLMDEYPRVSVFVNLVVPSNRSSNDSDPELKRQAKKPKFNSKNVAKDLSSNASGAVYIVAVKVMKSEDEPMKQLYVRYFEGWASEFRSPAIGLPSAFGTGGYRDLESDSSGSGIDKINPTRLKKALQDVVNMRMQNPSVGTYTGISTKKSIAVLACTVSEAIRFCYVRNGIHASLGLNNPPSFVPPMVMINKWDARGVSLNDFLEEDEPNKVLNLKPS